MYEFLLLEFLFAWFWKVTTIFVTSSRLSEGTHCNHEFLKPGLFDLANGTFITPTKQAVEICSDKNSKF